MASLEQLIEERHPLPEWATFRELANGTGARSTRRIDVAAFNAWPSKKGHRVAYEVKRSRSDWLRELSTPEKRAWCEEHFTECYFVALGGIAETGEVPDGWGLLVPTKDGTKLRRVVVARQRRPAPLPESIALAALRRASEDCHRERSRMVRIGAVELTAEVVEERLNALVGEQLRFQMERLEQTRRAVEDERHALAVARVNLAMPLEVLRDAVLGFRRRNDALTAEHVSEWIRRVEAGDIVALRTEVRRLRDQCDRVLGGADG